LRAAALWLKFGSWLRVPLVGGWLPMVMLFFYTSFQPDGE
jgi:hypothetical protein